MKTKQYLGDTVEQATIVIHPNFYEQFKKNLEEIKADFHEVSRGEDFVGVSVKNIRTTDLAFFDKNDANVSYINFCLFRKGKLYIRIHTKDTSRPNKRVDNIEIGFFYNKENGEESSRRIADVFEWDIFLAEKPSHYTVSWPSWGSSEIADVKLFAEGIQLAVGLAEDCQLQFC